MRPLVTLMKCLAVLGVLGLTGLGHTAGARAAAQSRLPDSAPATQPAPVAPSAPATQPRLVRLGLAPRLPAGSAPLSGVAGDVRLRITVALAPRNPAALAAYAQAVSDPGSALYRHFLTPAAFAHRFAPGSATVAAVRAALVRQGLDPGPLNANHLSFSILAPAGRLETGLHTELARVRLATGRAALVNTSAPALPASVAPAVQAIIGLDGLATMRSDLVRPRARKRPLNSRSAAATTHVRSRQVPRACASASSAAGAQGAYTADQIAASYRFDGLFNAGDQGAGVSIGVYELEPNAPSDLAAYQACYGTDTPVSYQAVDGGSGSGAGSGEAAFDIEQIIGLAPRANIVVYQGPNSNTDTPGSGPYDIFAQMIGQDRVSIISNSWGVCESQEGLAGARAENTLFQEAAIQGQTVVSAAGDTGAQDCLLATSTPNENAAVDDPGSQPYVTDVGGTSLTSLGPAPSEAVWNNGGSPVSAFAPGAGAGGGGVSSFWAMPAYQSGATTTLGVINPASSQRICAVSSGYCREVPDVSADADPTHGYLIYYNGDHSQPGVPSGWQATGGTSGAAPLWAAAFALVDADPACAGAPIGFANPVLYRVAGAGEGSLLNDVTTGNNDFTGTNHGAFPAAPGYDMASGLGTPNLTALAGALCASSLHLGVPTFLESFVRTAASFKVSTSDAAGVPVTVTVSGLPSGVSFDPSTLTAAGSPSAAGRHVVRVQARDASGAIRVTSFLWNVAARPGLSRLRLTGTRSGRPVLSLRVSAGRSGAPVSTVILTLPAGVFLARTTTVSVSSPAASRRPAARVAGSGRRVVLTLHTATAAVLISFGVGALGESTALRRATRRGRRPQLTVTALVRDAAALESTVHGSVTPAN